MNARTCPGHADTADTLEQRRQVLLARGAAQRLRLGRHVRRLQRQASPRALAARALRRVATPRTLAGWGRWALVAWKAWRVWQGWRRPRPGRRA
ncbi:MAG: hypothetical protein HY856_19135 [Burkholderiales bacterium]|nr:hypothetical protein [Burkholderiales bacterium]